MERRTTEDDLRGLSGYTIRMIEQRGRWDAHCKILGREPESEPKTKHAVRTIAASSEPRKRKKKWPWFTIEFVDGIIARRNQADIIIGGSIRKELPPEDPFARNYASLKEMAYSREIIEGGVTLGEFIHFYKDRANPCGLWWMSARGALERPLTYLELFTLTEAPPAPGWTLVTDAYGATAKLKSGVAIESEIREAERLVKRAKQIKRLEDRVEAARATLLRASPGRMHRSAKQKLARVMKSLDRAKSGL